MTNIKMNFIDRAISVFSPKAAYGRMQHKQALAYFDGATRSHRGKTFRNSSAGPETVTTMGLETLRARSRDMSRNNPWATKALNVLVGNMVGTGIVGTVKDNEFLNDLWQEWSQNTTNASADDMLDFAGIQDLSVRSVIDGAECFIRRRWRRISDGYTVPFQLELLEAEFLDSYKNEDLPNGNRIVQGVEFNRLGKRVAYWLYSRHPHDMAAFTQLESKRIRAEDIIHLYRVDRPGQVRGVPWIAPNLLRMKDFEDYEDAQLMRQKIAACFTAFVHGAGVGSDTPAGASDNNAPIPKLAPGYVGKLPDGMDITFANPPKVDGYGEYSKNQLRAFAAGYGITFEDLTGDYSGFNFSSARMSRGSMFKNIDRWQKNIVIQRLCQRVGEWFAEAVSLTDADQGAVKFRWTKPRREMVDPAKEIAVIIKMVRSGLCSLTQAITELGYDPKDVLSQIKADNDLLDELDLVLDSDARRVSLSGVTQSSNPFETDSKEDETNEE